MPAQRFAVALLTLFFFASAGTAAAQSIPSPEEFFGFPMGAEKQLARWDGMLEYFTLIADASDRVVVDTVGSTTLGSEFVTLTISAPQNLANLASIQEASKRIADGRISRSEAEQIAAAIPATAVIHQNIHSTEIGTSQSSVQIIYELASGTDETIQTILDDVVTVYIPSGNPDGQMMVTDWYQENVDTEFERARMPWLYHHYAGHDNNRDFFQANLIETRHWMDLMYHRAYPQLYLDQHQMGRGGPRMFVPPYPDPMNPDVHPLQWQQLQFMGGGMVADLQAAGKKGVVTGSMYRIWGQEGALTGRYHNIVALLTETASSRLASPDTVELATLEMGAAPGRGLSEYGFQMAFVDPWMGGEWPFSEVVDYQVVAGLSFLEQSARFREHYIMGRWQMASETIARGESEGPGAYVIPLDQDDPIAAAELADKLILQGVEVHRATEAFTATPQTDLWYTPADGTMSLPETDEDAEEQEAETRMFPAGSWVVYGAQPGRAAVLDLLEVQNRRLQREWPDGPYMRSYDGAAYTMPMQMGVETHRVDAAEVGNAERASGARFQPAPVPTADEWFAFSAKVTRNFQTVNRLLDAGIDVSKAESDAGPVFLVRASDPDALVMLTQLSGEIGTEILADPVGLSEIEPRQAARIGVYQGWAASMDEGWTRLVLDEFEYGYESLSNDDVRADDLRERFDVIVLPSEIPLNRLIEGATGDAAPPEYRGGIGEEGVENLQAFVRGGGTLVTLERADELVIERFGVPVRNAASGLESEEFFLPASLLRLELDTEHPIAMGSDEEVAAKWAGGRAYEPTGFGGEGRVEAVGRWAEDPDRVLMSGLLHGAEHVAGKGAVLDVEYGDGRILMYGFRVQHRGQTHGTFKLLFNALLKSEPRPIT